MTEEDLLRKKRNKELAAESFLRRAAETEAPFMLKGSHVTRHYFQNPQQRYAVDLDWVYLLPLADAVVASSAFQNWMLAVCKQPAHDGVEFTCKWEGQHWVELDYAMADDFPTISSYIHFTVNGRDDGQKLKLDFSFNLPVEVPPVPLLFTPQQGQPFELPLTAPLALQVSWKLHQSLVRLRFKDIYDLIHLLQHPQFTSETAMQSWEALVNECNKDYVPIASLRYVLEGHLEKLYEEEAKFPYLWAKWRYGGEQYDAAVHVWLINEAPADQVLNTFFLTESLEEFQQQLREAVAKAGIAYWVNNLESVEEAMLLEHNAANSHQTIKVKPWWKFWG